MAEGGPGGFFAVTRHSPDLLPEPPWLPLAELATDPMPLLDRIASVRARLSANAGRDVGERVAAATAHLGLVARLAAAGLAESIATDRLAAPSPDGLAAPSPDGPAAFSPDACWWQPDEGDPVPLSVAPAPTTGALGWLDSASLVTEVTRRHTGLSAKVLWGNVASGSNTAAVLLARHDPGARRAIARQLAAVTLDPRLRGEPGPYGPGFRRRSCCLAYRAGLGYCGDCVLTHPRRGAFTR